MNLWDEVIRMGGRHRTGGMPGPPELLILLIVILVLFGGAKLPKLAKSLGEAQHEFKKATDHATTDHATTDHATTEHATTEVPSPTLRPDR